MSKKNTLTLKTIWLHIFKGLQVMESAENFFLLTEIFCLSILSDEGLVSGLLHTFLCLSENKFSLFYSILLKVILNWMLIYIESD